MTCSLLHYPALGKVKWKVNWKVYAKVNWSVISIEVVTYQDFGDVHVFLSYHSIYFTQVPYLLPL